MTHPDDDTLLKSVLRILDEEEDAAVRQHLSSCEPCREKERKTQAEIGRISSALLPVETISPPRLRRTTRVLITASKLAAVLAIGFLLGYTTSQLSNPVPPVPIQQRMVPSRAAIPASGYVPAPEVDMRTPPHL